MRLTTIAAAALAAAVTLAGCATEPDANAAGGSGTRAITHVRGTTQVPDAPQRVVVLEPLELDTAVALGITPVGAAVASNVAGIPSYLGVDGITPVGTVPEPDLEAIASLKPDLILGTDARHAKLYDQLASVAPTVFIKTQADPWQDNALLIGDALNRADQVRTLLDDYQRRCASIKDTYAVGGKTAQLIRPRDETTLSLYGPVSFAGSTLECVGFSIPPQDWADGLQADISPENILKAKADHVFVTTKDVTDTTTIPAAIRDNQREFPSVTLVDTSYWVSGVGPKGAQKVLDDIEQFLTTTR
ncbi:MULTISPECIES: iron-siderophore ABC transporter substrate-binding protein [Catenuloplanes]|uniref:Iron complex transport system substrate-binding protein n=1 Tax=Catenuloplanes niger TaxID=587534 RepID=A0AAE3ZIH6_9ACTN|nr:iron-siderophore ABC transporter substrate-binding protein [Catenuloplanes niger]MDR7320569.1 iron complex transport system substrate-binding protein [Catenuloplanes niger]